MHTDSLENLSPTIIKRFRYLEWLFLFTHLILSIADNDFELPLYLIVYAIAIAFSWRLPLNRSLKFKQAYIWLALGLIVLANFQDISFDLLLYLYIAKSFFLLGGKHTTYCSVLAGIGWVASECLAETENLNLIRYKPPFGSVEHSLVTVLVFSTGIYLAVSIFVIFFSSTIIAEQKSRKQAEALTEQVEIMAKNLERTRIARDIHDSLGHTLTNLDIQLKVAQKLRARDREKAFQAIDLAVVLSAQCIEDVSHAVQTMRRSDFNLNRALTSLMEQINSDPALTVEWEINLPQPSLSTSHQIYCVVKEGLINIQKHARATKVSFQGYSTVEQIILELKDDGVGFGGQQTSSGFGLKGMQERIQTLKGKLSIHSAPNQGTQILVTIPR